MHKLHNLSGEQKNQLLIICNQFGIKLGLADREKCHSGKGITHLAFIAFLKDKDGKLILTKRSKTKTLWPGSWDAAVVSHILPGESAGSAAKRRGKEELGVNIYFKDLGAFYYQASQGKNSENEYCHVLIGKTNEVIHPNPVEIDEVKAISAAEILREIKSRPKNFTPWFMHALENKKLLTQFEK